MIDRGGLDVLVVDDDPSLTDLVAGRLAAAGHRARTAADGHEALVAIGEARPDVVVLDVRMPVLDGWGVLDALAEEPTTAGLPVIVLTGSADEADLIRAHLTGAVAYLNKPFEIATLLDAVAEAVVPLTTEQRQRRRVQLRGFVGRLAALDAGRDAGGPGVRFSRLEPVPRPVPPAPLPSAERLTPRQRLLAGLLAGGLPPRAVADRLGTSRSNVYATRARIAGHLGVRPEQVADTARRIGLATHEGGVAGTDDLG